MGNYFQKYGKKIQILLNASVCVHFLQFIFCMPFVSHRFLVINQISWRRLTAMILLILLLSFYFFSYSTSYEQTHNVKHLPQTFDTFFSIIFLLLLYLPFLCCLDVSERRHIANATLSHREIKKRTMIRKSKRDRKSFFFRLCYFFYYDYYLIG